MENWGGITFFESRLLFDPADELARRAARHLQHPGARNGAPVVRRSRHQGVVGQHLAQRGLRQLDAGKAAEALHPDWQSLAQRRRLQAGRHGARTRGAPRIRSSSRSPTRPRRWRCSTSSPTARARRSSACSKPISARTRSAPASGATCASTPTATPPPPICGARSKRPPASRSARSRPPTRSRPAFRSSSARRAASDGEQRIALQPGALHGPRSGGQAAALAGAGRVRAGRRGAARAIPCCSTARPRSRPGAAAMPVKLNLGDVGYYRVQYDAAMQAALARSIAALPPADRINLLADTWALVEAGAQPAVGLFRARRHILAATTTAASGAGDPHLVTRIDQLQRGRAGTGGVPGLCAADCGRCSTGSAGTRRRARRTSGRSCARGSIRALGDLGDEAVIAEAKRRFEAFLKDPASLAADLRDPVTTSPAATPTPSYDTLLGACPQNHWQRRARALLHGGRERARSGASPRTLALALTDELPKDLVGTVISRVAAQGEHPDLALAFVKEHFEALSAKLGPNFRSHVRLEPDARISATVRAPRSSRTSRRCTRPIADGSSRRATTSGSSPTPISSRSKCLQSTTGSPAARRGDLGQ